VKNEVFFREKALAFRINKCFFREMVSVLRTFTKGMFLQKYTIRIDIFLQSKYIFRVEASDFRINTFFFREIASYFRINIFFRRSSIRC
jgi:hypothetical protein